MKKFPFLIAAWLSCFSGLCGCSSGFSTRQSPDVGFLRYALEANLTTIDPALSQDVATNGVMSQIFEGLVSYDEHNKLVPLLAESWTVSPNGKIYTFKLKSGVKFHNGQTLSAADFVSTWNRNCNAAFNSPLARNYLGDIVGVREKLEGKAATISGIKAVDGLTLTVQIDKPRTYFLGKLTYPVASVMPKSVPSNRLSKIHDVIGTGPFKLADYVSDLSLKLVRFDDYHGGKPIAPGQLISIMKDPATRLNKYRAGELDFLSLPHEDVAAVAANEVHRFARAAVVFLAMNEASPIFKERAARRAVRDAIDRNLIVSMYLKNLATPAPRIVPPGIDSGSLGLAPAAGSGGLTPGQKLELVIGGQSTDIRTAAEAIAGQLRDKLRLDVSIRKLEWTAYLDKATHGQLDCFMGSWYADYLDPENFLSTTLARDGQNRVNYSNPAFSQLCERADAMALGNQRISLYRQAETLALEDAVWVPIYWPTETIAIRPELTGWKQNLFGFLPFKDVLTNHRP